MMQLQNSERRYGAVAIALHWVMALLLTALVALGLYMTSLPDVGFDTWKIRLILYHKQLGMLALMLVFLRLIWRLGNVLPHLVESLPDWQKVLARFVHLCFYGLMLALPITGWLMSSATGIPVSVLGLFTLPDLVPYDDRLFHTLVEMHRYLGYALIVCMAAHIGAALRHHLLLRDHTLKKMLPGSDATQAARRSTAGQTRPSAAEPSQ
jgi:cytochrome b561